MISDDEHHDDYIHTFGGAAQTLTQSCNYSKLYKGGGDYHLTQTVDTMKRNEAYANRRSESIEIILLTA